MPLQQNQSAWNRRLRRLTYFFGAAGTFYLISTYALDRMKEARIRAIRERKERDLLKSHFSTLLSTLSFTLYALLPTLSPQLNSAYPVERTSQALQGLSNPASSQISTADNDSEAGRMIDSNVPDMPGHEGDDMARRSSSGSGEGPESVSESWASEFRENTGMEQSIDSFGGQTETDDGLSSATSQPISLPPTDLSISSGSPPSDMMASSHLQLSPSPPRHRDESPNGGDSFSGKSKKELWRDLKVQSITRALTTAYLLPLLYLLTTSQLSTLARERYLADVQASLPVADPSVDAAKSSGGIVGLITETASLLPNPLGLLPSFVASRLPWASAPSRQSEEDELAAAFLAEEKKEAEEIEKAEAERMYLTYSWWILHEGWRAVARRVEASVEGVIGPMGLKRELSVDDWEGLIRDIRRQIDQDEASNKPFDFSPHLLPPSPLPHRASEGSCPLPISPPSPHLYHLLLQTRTHLASPDALYLIQGGVEVMTRKLLESLSSELYDLSPLGRGYAIHIDGENGSLDTKRRLAECLPAFSRWGKGVWEGVPDVGVESLLSMGEFESFAGLIFGDWA